MSEDEIAVHKVYDNLFYHSRSTKEEKLIINESIDRYCRKHSIQFEHMFTLNAIGNLIPRKIKSDCRMADIDSYSTKYMLIKSEIMSIIEEIRCKLNKRKANEEYGFIWFDK